LKNVIIGARAKECANRNGEKTFALRKEDGGNKTRTSCKNKLGRSQQGALASNVGHRVFLAWQCRPPPPKHGKGGKHSSGVGPMRGNKFSGRTKKRKTGEPRWTEESQDRRRQQNVGTLPKRRPDFADVLQNETRILRATRESGTGVRTETAFKDKENGPRRKAEKLRHLRAVV